MSPYDGTSAIEAQDASRQAMLDSMGWPGADDDAVHSIVHCCTRRSSIYDTDHTKHAQPKI